MPNGGGKCWQEFKGWLKAFTPIERLLTVLEAILLVLLIVFIIFLILHFISCQSVRDTVTTPSSDTSDSTAATPPCFPSAGNNTSTTPRKSRPTCTYTPNATVADTGSTRPITIHTDVVEDVTTVPVTDETTETWNSDGIIPSLTDGEIANEDDKQIVVALVKIKPSGVTFGCILTVVSDHWTVTAASCLDAIEEVDSLDNFVIIENYDEPNKGRSHAVTDVRIHPLYEGRNKSYDLALLRSADLGRTPVRLPALLDYFRLPVGSAARILGFGSFRTIDQSVPQRVHSATVHILPSKHCTPSQFEERHLTPISPISHGRCGRAPLCCGVLYARGTPCNYCAGAPLMHGRVLLGVMADNEQCGAACEPALYANIAESNSWIVKILTTTLTSY